jgi:hypothetical protein
MRMMMHVSFPTEEFNVAVRDGTVSQKISRILDEIKPEAVYFTEREGERGAYLVVEVKDASQIPALAEPWFLMFSSNVEFRIAMTPDDLQKAGLEKLGKKYAE